MSQIRINLTGDSDDEHETESPSVPQWREFEKNVGELIARLDESAVVEHDVRTSGLVSGVERQIDVLVTAAIADQVVRIAVECKRYSKSIGIGGVDEFVGKLLDLRVDRGVLYALNGFTGGAIDRAKNAHHPVVVLRDLSGEDPATPEWTADLVEFRSTNCPNANCYYGDIDWRLWEQGEGESVEAGMCHNCGTWAVRCRSCDGLSGFFMDEVECYSCNNRYRLIWDSDDASVEHVSVVVEDDP